jgi:hypothetical protein
LHRQFSFFEARASARRAAKPGRNAGQSDTKCSGAKKRPAAKIKRLPKLQVGSFPKPPDTGSGNGPSSTPNDSVMPASLKK